MVGRSDEVSSMIIRGDWENHFFQKFHWSFGRLLSWQDYNHDVKTLCFKTVSTRAILLLRKDNGSLTSLGLRPRRSDLITDHVPKGLEKRIRIVPRVSDAHQILMMGLHNIASRIGARHL